MLISTATLRERLNDPNWVVFDCRHDLTNPEHGAKLYANGHVPGAYFAPVDEALSGTKTGTNGRHPLPEAEAFAEFLNRHGIKAETMIVAYDDVGSQYAARLWWLVRWIGLTRVGVLDGGWLKWCADGLPVSSVTPSARGRGTVIARPDATLVRRTDEVLAAVQTGGALVLDARASERFRGEIEPLDPVAGHIPGAVNRCYKDNLNTDQTFRPPGELRREFESLLAGRTPDGVIHHCGSGITACANLLAMEHAGLAGSKLYAGSWSEWVSDPARPVARG